MEDEGSLNDWIKGKLGQMLAMCRILLISEVGRMTADTNAMDAAPGGQPQAHPAVSVVVPCYNAGRFLDGLMASLAEQTLRDFEIIIVDDGSSEEETLRKLAELEKVVRVIHQDNRGLSAARNAGFRAARAESRDAARLRRPARAAVS